jgi:thiamine-phosphate pyrophosphorylase
LNALARIAATLGRRARAAKGGPPIPGLWFFTDPARTPDPGAVARRLPAGSVVVYRAFGADDAPLVARRLRKIARDRDLRLLIGADAGLAAEVGADGVHLPQRMMGLAPRLARARPGWLISAAAHDAAAMRRGSELGVHALVVSAVFPSRSPSASRALGPIRFAALVKGSAAPVIALGGITSKNAPRLLSTGAAGIAAVEGLAGKAQNLSA